MIASGLSAWALSPRTGVFRRDQRRHTESFAKPGGVVKPQPRNSWSYQSLEECLLEVLKTLEPCQHLDFWMSDFQNCDRMYFSFQPLRVRSFFNVSFREQVSPLGTSLSWGCLVCYPLPPVLERKRPCAYWANPLPLRYIPSLV